jgi:uncharacterized protein YdeI (YjbR/CyaY-like superfamily)
VPDDPTFFPTPADFRAWLARHHRKRTELLVGFHKRGSGKPSITWPESVDAALSFGWIDGVRRSLGEESYTIRFTPRKPRSIWSAVNVRRAKALIEAGLMSEAGLAAFEARSEARSVVYAYEQRESAKLERGQERRLRANAAAWKFFAAQPAWYRRTASWWVISAKRPETREKRLATLIGDSASGRTIKPLTRR